MNQKGSTNGLAIPKSLFFMITYSPVKYAKFFANMRIQRNVDVRLEMRIRIIIPLFNVDIKNLKKS